jgi:integrase
MPDQAQTPGNSEGTREKARLGKHVTMHGMRRTAATMLKQKGASTNTIRGILNHSEEKVTTRYLGVPKDDEVAGLEMLCTADFLPKLPPD